MDVHLTSQCYLFAMKYSDFYDFFPSEVNAYIKFTD